MRDLETHMLSTTHSARSGPADGSRWEHGVRLARPSNFTREGIYIYIYNFPIQEFQHVIQLLEECHAGQTTHLCAGVDAGVTSLCLLCHIIS